LLLHIYESFSGNIKYFRIQQPRSVKMMKQVKKRKLKKRLKEMSPSVKSNNSVLRNVEVAGILSEIHPIAAGVYNHAYFVIIQQKKRGDTPESGLSSPPTEELGRLEKENLTGSNEKPKYTYRELITLALMDKTSLTLSNIYSWICNFCPFYSSSDEKWKNSIRHNLSLYPEFVKGEKTPDGAGHLWYLDGTFRSNYLDERHQRIRRKSEQMNSSTAVRQKSVEAIVEDVIEEEMKSKVTPTFYQAESRLLDLISSPELQKSAEEILAGIKRPTEVIENSCIETFSAMYDRES